MKVCECVAIKFMKCSDRFLIMWLCGCYWWFLGMDAFLMYCYEVAIVLWFSNF